MTLQSPPTHSAKHLPKRLQSGTHTVPIAIIEVGKRHRKEFGDLQALADSIMQQGLLQPIGLTQDYRLVFGERRLRAHQGRVPGGGVAEGWSSAIAG